MKLTTFIPTLITPLSLSIPSLADPAKHIARTEARKCDIQSEITCPGPNPEHINAWTFCAPGIAPYVLQRCPDNMVCGGSP
jgi:hypothetical protein